MLNLVLCDVCTNYLLYGIAIFTQVHSVGLLLDLISNFISVIELSLAS